LSVNLCLARGDVGFLGRHKFRLLKQLPEDIEAKEDGNVDIGGYKVYRKNDRLGGDFSMIAKGVLTGHVPLSVDEDFKTIEHNNDTEEDEGGVRSVRLSRTLQG
jgi:hypothetical protein